MPDGDTCSGSYNRRHMHGERISHRRSPGPAMALWCSKTARHNVGYRVYKRMGNGPQIALGPARRWHNDHGVDSECRTMSNPQACSGRCRRSFIADIENSRVVEMPAGGGPPQASPDGEWHTFNIHAGHAVDGAGDLFIGCLQLARG